MKIAIFLIIILTANTLVGCATSFKPREEGMRRLGYTDREISENNYEIDVYGANFDTYEGLEKLWHRRAQELCHTNQYTSKLEHATYPGKTWIVIIPVVWIDNNDPMPLVKGVLTCNE